MNKNTIPNNTFAGLAFPVVKVRYSGNSGRYVASCYRDSDRTYRASVAYDHGMPAGATQALVAAKACYAKALADNAPDTTVDDYVAIPGDLSADSYSFTFVPADYLNGALR